MIVKKTVTPIIMAAFLLSACSTAVGPSKQAAAMTLETVDGSQSVTVILQGATRDEETVKLATALRDLRLSLSKSQAQARLAIASDAYDEAVRELIAVTHTSASYDTERASTIRRLTDEAQRVLSASTEPPDNVATQIDAAMEAGRYRVFYVPVKRRAAASASEWQSYNFGQLLHIGTYVFRIVPEATNEFEEVIVVFDDPTRRTINPR
jgi:hypothetical protein